jgi:uncharacterized membrane protein YphA (DoxX/SURF4 family)
MDRERISGGAMTRFLTVTRQIVRSEYLSLALRLHIGMVFTYAGMSKIGDPAAFSETLASYQILPHWSINFVAVFLPWLEIVCGLQLMIGLRTRLASCIAGFLLFLFTIVLVINVVRDAPISCGCFDHVGEEIGWWEVVRDVSWLLLTVQVFFFDRIYLLSRGLFARTEK